MNNSIGKAMLCEENKDFIVETINELCRLCEVQQISLNNEYVRDCIDDILVFYEHYLKTLKSKFLDIDFYKIVSWFAVFMGTKMYEFNVEKDLTHNKNWARVVFICVWRMIQELEGEEKKIPNGYMETIVYMVLSEIKNKPDFGIGKNGLYMLMKLVSVVEIKASTQPTRS